MPVSGLIVTLSEDTDLRAHALQALAAKPEVTLGDGCDESHCWLPIALEAETLAASRDLAEELSTLPGIDLVELVSVDFSDLQQEGGQ